MNIKQLQTPQILSVLIINLNVNGINTLKDIVRADKNKTQTYDIYMKLIYT